MKHSRLIMHRPPARKSDQIIVRGQGVKTWTIYCISITLIQSVPSQSSINTFTAIHREAEAAQRN